uniref:Uncharacterized protein n=1 Tax=Fagus sylvatica TaxID=28930 RepID=A0A2N9I1W5_FAGSY
MGRELQACRFLVLVLCLGFVFVLSTIQARTLHAPNHHHHHNAMMKPMSPSQAKTSHYFDERWWRRKAGVVDKRWCEDEVVSERWCEMGLLASGDARWGCRRALVPTSSAVNSANSWNPVKVKVQNRWGLDEVGEAQNKVHREASSAGRTEQPSDRRKARKCHICSDSVVVVTLFLSLALALPLSSASGQAQAQSRTRTPTLIGIGSGSINDSLFGWVAGPWVVGRPRQWQMKELNYRLVVVRVESACWYLIAWDKMGCGEFGFISVGMVVVGLGLGLPAWVWGLWVVAVVEEA